MIEGLGKFLSYGAIGLGLALAVLAFLLLTAEQKVAKPRKQIIKATYIFMIFSLFLSGAGFSLEIYKLSHQPDNAPPLFGSSDAVWNDIVRATRSKLFGVSAPRKEYGSGYLTKDKSLSISAATDFGQCSHYFAMTKPPAEIKVEVFRRNPYGSVTVLGTEPHMSFGRFCEGKGPGAPQALQSSALQ